MGRVAFGHRRLKILDLSECGAQPMVDNELGLATVFNGLIYNFRELREELEGHGYRFFSTPTPRCCSRPSTGGARRASSASSGMFAFAVAERDTGVLTLGRDRLGIKPLYYTQTPDRMRFASALPALLEGGDVDTSIDRVALHHYMTLPLGRPGAAHDPRGRAQAPARPPCARSARTARSPSTSTGAPSTSGAPSTPGCRRARLARRRARRAAAGGAQRRMVADVPVGVLLSGGLDSSLVVGLLAEEGQVGLKTFSVGFHATAGE